MQCGLGRTGWLFAYERTDVVPDVVTLAKPLAGGLPMGAVLMSAGIAASVEAGDHGSTFGGGPFVSTVAKHVFDRLSDPALLARVRENGAWLGESLRALAVRRNEIRAVRGVGYLWGIDVTRPAGEIVASAREAGLLILTAGDFTVRLLPPLIATRDELARAWRSSSGRCGERTDLAADGAAADVPSIVALVNGYASDTLMLPITAERVVLALADFIVAADARGRVRACGALKEYSPSLAEVASLAVARDARGSGLGTRVVAELEALARVRGIDELFALTMSAGFFESAGYAVTERTRYPEKILRDCTSCARRVRLPRGVRLARAAAWSSGPRSMNRPSPP